MGVRACPDCGKVQDDSNVFCPQCGKAFSAPPARQPLPRRESDGAGPAVAGSTPAAREVDQLFAQLRQAERTMTMEAQRSGKRRVGGCLVLLVVATVLAMWVMSRFQSAP